MDATQFIKEHGVEKAMEVVECAPEFPVFGYCALTGSYIFKRKDATAYYHNETNSWSEEYAIELIFLDDLKRLVESVDFINKFGGIDLAKAYDKQMIDHGFAPFFDKAITDYESIYSIPKSVIQAILNLEMYL